MYSHPTADRVVRFVSRLYSAIGLELPRYQRCLIQRLYGTVKANGLRQYRRVYFSVPRKNAKSSLAAALALYHLVADHEDNPRIFIAAPNLDTAGESFEIIARMVEAVPFLNRNCIVRDSRNAKEVTYFKDGKKHGYIKALTRGQKEGKNASVVTFDELCSFKEPDRAIWNSMTKGSIARRQPLFIVTTTAAEANDGLAWEQYQHARKVKDGLVYDPQLFPFIVEADPDRWDDPQERIRVNPLVAEGFIPIENLEAEYQQAKVSDHALALFRRKTLNCWVGSSFSFLDWNAWMAQTEPINDSHLIGLPCVAAFDLSKRVDFTCLCLLFHDTGRYFVKPHFFLPKPGLRKRAEKEGQPFDLWAEQGYITLCDSETIDYHVVLDRLNELAGVFHIAEVAYDPWQAEHLVQDLEKAGFTLSEFRQGFKSMTAPLKELQSLVLNRKIVHGHNPVMNWQVPQLLVKEDEAGNVKPNKAGRKNKIDGPVALTMCLGIMLRHLNKPKPMKSSLSWFNETAA